MDAKAIIQGLKDGNGRYVDGNAERISQHVHGQRPSVAILTCADSRVPPELIFDAWLGDIFTVRVAGNVAFDPSVIESLEYAVVHLTVPLLVIMGHTHCGAVKAAEAAETDEGLLGEVAASFRQDGDHVLDNLYRQLKTLPKRSGAISKALEGGGLTLVGAIYDLETGSVGFL